MSIIFEGDPGLRRVFGRIVKHDKRHDEHPFIIVRDEEGIPLFEVKVRTILDLLNDGKSEKQIKKQFKGLTGQDIQACRAWQARFEPGTLTKLFNRVSNQNVIMLDENISYMVLPDVVRIFGRSSHVYADDLGHKDDEKDIWSHLLQKGYQAIITNDDDFEDISTRYREKIINKYGSVAKCPHPIPVVIRVPQVPPKELPTLLAKHYDNITKYIKDNNAAYAEIKGDRFFKRGHDSQINRGANDNNNNPRDNKPGDNSGPKLNFG